jgi:hypothetical protein
MVLRAESSTAAAAPGGASILLPLGAVALTGGVSSTAGSATGADSLFRGSLVTCAVLVSLVECC